VDDTQLTRDVPLNWTTAQKSDCRNFSTGQVLGFNRAVKGIAKNETLEVVRVTDKGIVVLDAAGRERTLTAKQAKSFDVYERRCIEVATGDRLLLTANRRENGFRATNGEIVTVAEVDRAGRICLEDGRTLPSSFRQFTHGYAVTAHRSQGKSVDAVVISGDGMRKELFYVAASRGRQSVRVITSDKESLRESVARSSMRKSASELARKAGTVFVRGACRGIMAARNLAMRLTVRETQPAPAEINYQSEPRLERHRERGIGR
jgi:ATP-dependent exoDNAse (exonuclease V) alpha subunit